MSLEHKVIVKKEEELKTLYSWFISEIDDEGNEVSGFSSKSIPYHYSVGFQIKNIYYQTDIEIENEKNEYSVETKTKEVGNAFKTNRGERIYGSLKIDEHYDTRLSMFGTNRKIEDIALSIYRAEEEYCSVWGIPEYSTEIDFREDITPDCIEISIGLKDNDYQEIAERIKDKSINSYFITLKNVKGFYSPWSPQVSTPEIKVLTQEHEVNIDENALPDGYELPRLGNVGSFTMISRFAYELSKEDKTEESDEESDIDEPFDSIVPLSTSERIQEETKQELSKLLSLIQNQQKYLFWGVIALIVAILISGS